MKRLLGLLAILIFAVGAVSPAFAGAPAPVGSDDPPAEPAAVAAPVTPNAGKIIYLPLTMGPVPMFDVSGQIKDINDLPISGVTVSSDTGSVATTDANGVYNLKVHKGERRILATYAGKNFDPLPAWVDLQQDMHNVNFSAGAACITPIPNQSFETLYYWNPISGGANGYTPFYTNSRAHTGAYSGFTGIPVGWDNVVSQARWRSHEIYVPTDAISITVSLYYWPRSTEATLWRSEAEENEATSADLSGYNTDSPEAPVVGDWQYVYLTDQYNNWVQTLMSRRRNDQAWVPFVAAIPATGLRGRWLKLEFGSYNDGWGGVTSAYFDDVSVSVCNGAVVSTCTTTPRNLILNSDFETPAAGWTISPAVRPSQYNASGLFAFSGITSMQSGMPLGAVPPAGIWTTSEFYQYVTIPMTATYATLSVRLLPRSTDAWGYHILEQQKLDAELQAVQARGESPLVPDAWESQYGYICAYPQCGPNDPATIQQLIRWFPVDSHNWLYRSWDLTQWRGSPIGILFGAQDFGDWGNTALYVDDVQLMVCP